MRTLAGRRFGWLDAELLAGGTLRELAPDDLATYAFLCLVADREGVSFYSLARLGLELGLDDQRARRALARLRALNLVGFAPFSANSPEGYHQVLALPCDPETPCTETLGLLSRLAADLGDSARLSRRPQ